jgi:putative pyruvate formate lyase activating enzyme
MTLDEVCDAITDLLPLSEDNLGFVSPAHFVPQMMSIVKELRRRGHYPTIVYNTNGYDLPETIRKLEGIVDVWLPDFKYSDDNLAAELSGASQYSKFALSSLKEMVHQVGTSLHTDDRGIARRGIIIRHLVLPGFIDSSIGVLKLIAEDLSPNLNISLMSQYYPTQNLIISTPEPGGVTAQKCGGGGLSDPVPSALSPEPYALSLNTLTRPITRREYETVVVAFHDHGFTRGWLQDYDSHLSYRPDFSKESPFE